MSDMPENSPRPADAKPRRRLVGMYDRPAQPAISPMLITGFLIALLIIVAIVLFMILR